MSREVQEFVASGGRDAGRTFILHEMPSEEGELWAMQAAYLIEKAGVDVKPGEKEGGMEGLAAIYSRDGHTVAFLRAIQDPSLASMWQYVKFQPGPGLPEQELFKGVACQIEEISTRVQIRLAFLRLHLRFFSRGRAQTSASSESTASKSPPA